MHTHIDFQTFLGPCVRYYTALLILLHYKEANTYSTVNIQSKYSSSTLAPFGQCMVMVKAEGVQSMLLLKVRLTQKVLLKCEIDMHMNQKLYLNFYFL